MSSNYCVQLNQGLNYISFVTINPINFPSLQFTLSTNSLVIFLFSKYPFNLGFNNQIFINYDEFGFAEVGTTFNIDLTNYQGYYMLILIYPQGVFYGCINILGVIYPANPDLTLTFQNTTISIASDVSTINNNCPDISGGFCTCFQESQITLGIGCNNQSNCPVILLNNLNNYLTTTTCQTFVIKNNTTITFVTPSSCLCFGSNVIAMILFKANQEVIDFLNNNNISYNILTSNTCQMFKYFPSCNSVSVSIPTLPCKSIYQIKKLLIPPKKHSIISSKLWNEIVQDLYLAYSIYKYIKYLSQFPYIQNIYRVILDFYNFYETFQPYIFKPLIHARKGLPLTTDYFNSLIDAIIELANMTAIQLQKGISHVQPDQIVKSLQFDNIVYNVNQLLTFNFNQYFLLDCNGNKFYNLLNSISTFLNVLINSPINDIIIPNNIYIKNFLIYSNIQTFYIYGSIVNFLMNINDGYIYLFKNASVNSFILQENLNTIEINDNSYINNLLITQNSGTISINNNTFIKTLKIVNNSGTVNINDYVVIENLICKQNTGAIYIYGNAKIINNQCIS